MKLYIKSTADYTYYRIDHIGSRDKDEHCGFTSLSALHTGLKKFSLPSELANFDDRENLPDWITTEVLPSGTIENIWKAWKVSARK